MLISVVIPSRCRPFKLFNSVLTLWELRSGEHDIEFIIGLDDDDDDASLVEHLVISADVPFHVIRQPGFNTLGGKVDSLLKHCRGDVLTVLGDRCLALTLGWDVELAKLDLDPHRVAWWRGLHEICECPVMPRLWVKANAGPVVPDLFPFWHIDTWVREVDAFVSGRNPWFLEVRFANPRRGPTHDGRDLAFWAKVFAFTRKQRMEQAAHIRKRFSLPEPANMAEILDALRQEDEFRLENADSCEARFGTKLLPGEKYLKAKAKAECLLSGA